MTKKQDYILLGIYIAVIIASPFGIYNEAYQVEYYKQHLKDGCNKLEATCQSISNNTQCDYYVNNILFCHSNTECHNRTYKCYPKGNDITHCHISQTCFNHDNNTNEICSYLLLSILGLAFLIYIYLAIDKAYDIYQGRQQMQQMSLMFDYEPM